LRAHVLTEIGDRTFSETPVEEPKAPDNRQALLLFSTPDNGQMAIPLSAVARLEEFPRLKIERAGDQEVVQYRGEILPLLNLSQALPERRRQPRNAGAPADAARDTVQVVVYTHKDRSVGFVVDHILDIVEESLELQSPGTRSGVMGSAVIHGRVTELLDVENLIKGVMPGWFAHA
jgi:two-component system chemotaxis sensor kinase CheA